jgi:hypothetical protein
LSSSVAAAAAAAALSSALLLRSLHKTEQPMTHVACILSVEAMPSSGLKAI